jgi:transcriptional regulator with GAF, ATPase, and Fis domain
MTTELEVAQMFGEVARALAAHEDMQATLQTVVNLAVEHLHGCEYAGISRIERRKITSPASTGDVPRVIDRLQAELDQGPCLDAIREHEVFQTGDLEHEPRWPVFSQRAHDETGVRSILSLRLFIEEDTMGALNLYSMHKDAFDDTDVALGSVFAAHAAVAMQSTRREAQLEEKVASRDVIGRAKGILMARHHVTDDEAFTMLRRASQRLNQKVARLAKDMSASEEAGR